MKRIDLPAQNKYHAERTYSELCSRAFDSKGEARYAEELRIREMAGDILNLQYQMPFVLSVKPRVTITIDFCYQRLGELYYEDYKGVLTRDSRTKLAWLKDKLKIEVKLIRKE